jgi:transposase
MELSYPTDLTDEQWELISSLLPASKRGGRPRSVDLRAILNAIFYIVVAGCAWRMLPKGAKGDGAVLEFSSLLPKDPRGLRFYLLSL